MGRSDATLAAVASAGCALGHSPRASMGGRGIAVGDVAQPVGVDDDDDAGGDAGDALALPLAEAFVDAFARAADHRAKLALREAHMEADLAGGGNAAAGDAQQGLGEP